MNQNSYVTKTIFLNLPSDSDNTQSCLIPSRFDDSYKGLQNMRLYALENHQNMHAVKNLRILSSGKKILNTTFYPDQKGKKSLLKANPN